MFFVSDVHPHTLRMASQPKIDDATTAHRRERLRELIKAYSQIGLIRHIAQNSGSEPNQGELSALSKPNSGKSFREVKARNLERIAGLPAGWFDLPIGTALPTPQADSSLQCAEPTRAPYAATRENEEALLVRAFRLASPEVRRMWLDQAASLIAQHNSPSSLTGTDAPKPG